jgi:transcriptional regulator with XRE-family HTH domain
MPDSTNLLSTFAERLRVLIVRRNVDAKTVAEAIGVAASTVSRWATGTEHEPSLSGIRSLADYFGCSADYLCGRIDSDADLAPGNFLVDPVAHAKALRGAKLGPDEGWCSEFAPGFRICAYDEYADLAKKIGQEPKPRKKGPARS